MTGPEMQAIREKLKFNLEQMAVALGYAGQYGHRLVRRFENDERNIPPQTERLAIMYEKFGVPRELRKPVE